MNSYRDVPGLKSTATEVADIIALQWGKEFTVQCSGSIDKFKSEGKAEVVYCNDGHGFVQGVAVDSNKSGTMFYIGPFRIEAIPTSGRTFIFSCAGRLLVRRSKMGPPPRGSE